MNTVVFHNSSLKKDHDVTKWWAEVQCMCIIYLKSFLMIVNVNVPIIYRVFGPSKIIDYKLCLLYLV